MKLSEYQASQGVPYNEVICLLDGDVFPWNAHKLHQEPIVKPRSRVERILKRLINSNPETTTFTVPKYNSILFYGYSNKSHDLLSDLRELFQFIASKRANYKYIIICGKGDYDIKPKILNLMPGNITRIFLNNLNVTNRRAHYLPMGRDFHSKHLFQSCKPVTVKSTLVYCNFSVNTHRCRPEVKRMVSNHKFVKSDHMGEFLSYSISRAQFFSRLAKSKFSICPRGNAMDTFRLWDSIYLGTIPIVVREAVFHNLLDDLPIYFLDCYEDFATLTEQKLQEKYNEMLQMDWNYEKLYLSYWKSKIDGVAQASGISCNF